MLKEFKVDLHIHTCLSPCADLTMLPKEIIKHAKIHRLDCIGICDHNSAENVSAVKKAGKRENMYVLGGIEITSIEEVHILGFFDDESALMEMQEFVYNNITGENDADYFGEQLIVDENNTILGINEKLLIGSSNLTITEVENTIHGLSGVAVASHIDRESYSLIGQLGFIPDDLFFDALEYSPNCDSGKTEEYKNYGLPLVTSSDAHYLSDIGKTNTTFLLSTLSFSEILKEFKSLEGRKIRI